MKTFLLTLLGLALCVGTRGQQLGTVILENLDVCVNAPDYLCDSSTRLFGPQYVVELRAGPTPTNLTAVAQSSFTISGYPGYFPRAEASVGYCGFVWLQVDIWNTNAGPTFEAARASGMINAWAQSVIYSALGGGYCCEPPCTPECPSSLTSLRLNGPYSPPKIGITLISPQKIQLDWSYGLGNYAVEKSQNLQANSWTLVTNPPTVYASSNLLILPNPANTTFFRLIAQ